MDNLKFFSDNNELWEKKNNKLYTHIDKAEQIYKERIEELTKNKNKLKKSIQECEKNNLNKIAELKENNNFLKHLIDREDWNINKRLKTEPMPFFKDQHIQIGKILMLLLIRIFNPNIKFHIQLNWNEVFKEKFITILQMVTGVM